jgi:hypothetical protein
LVDARFAAIELCRPRWSRSIRPVFAGGDAKLGDLSAGIAIASGNASWRTMVSMRSLARSYGSRLAMLPVSR